MIGKKRIDVLVGDTHFLALFLWLPGFDNIEETHVVSFPKRVVRIDEGLEISIGEAVGGGGEVIDESSLAAERTIISFWNDAPEHADEQHDAL